MKIHAKLGGVTHTVPMPQFLSKDTLMIGADVTHPPPKASVIPPSIAVTVASINGDHTRVVPAIRLQEGRK
jgi:eukaryotic translation initiation factor 2C